MLFMRPFALRERSFGYDVACCIWCFRSRRSAPALSQFAVLLNPKKGLIMSIRHTILASLTLCVGLMLAPAAQAALPGPLQAKVDAYKKKMVEWAANPLLVKAAKEASAKGSGGMSNAKWEELADADPMVQASMSGPVSEQLRKWEADKGINKLYLRDDKGNVISGVARTLLFNAANRPHIAAALKGEVAQGQEVKPDPSTQVKSVQLAVPVLDGGKVVGVLHTAVSAE